MYFKLLGRDGKSCNGGNFQYDLPKRRKDGTWKPGEWTPKIEVIEPCKSGWHGCELKDALTWANHSMYLLEYKGELIDHGDKFVFQQIRLIRSVEEWNPKNLRLFAADCAERVIAIYEKEYPEDQRPRLAIQAAQKFAHGEITQEELNAAGDAAWDAAWDAAGDAAGDAAWDAAGAAARTAAGAAAWDAAWDAAGDAAGAAEQEWQISRLKFYLKLKD